METNDKNTPREDMFYSENIINAVVVSITEERATDMAKFLTGCHLMWKGYWLREDWNETYRIISYTRWPNNPKGRPTTIYADTMLVDVDSLEEFNLVEEYVRNRGRIPQIILYSPNDLSHLESTFRHHNCKWINKTQTDAESLRKMVHDHYLDLNKLIREVFDKFDVDQNGVIERNEIKNAAAELGEIITSEEFEQCFQVMDENHDGVISFQEFINWWKLGRQNSALMKKLVQLEMLMNQLINSDRLTELKRELDEVKDQTSLSKHYVHFYSQDLNEFGFQFFFNFIKGLERLEHVRGHLLQYQPHSLTEHARWVDFTFRFEESVNKDVALTLLKTTKVKLMELFNQINPNFYETFERLFIFEYYRLYDESAVVLRIRNKADTQKNIDHALFSLIQLLKSISTTQEVLLDFKLMNTLGEVLNGKISLSEAFSQYSLEIKTSIHRIIIQTLAHYLNSNVRKFLDLIFAPNDLNIICKLPLENLSNLADSFKNVNLMELLRPFVDLVKTYVDSDIIYHLNSVQICLNAYEVFATIKIKVKDLFI